METALSLALTQLQAAQVEIRRDYAPRETCIYADMGQMEQVFLNLLINACHAMVDRPATASPRTLQLRTRLIRLEGGAPQAQACVSDTGAGISPEDMPRIFEPFYTTKGLAGTDDVSGSGLGLSVARAMVTAHGGSIEVKSEPGVGTTFVLTFPALDDARAHARPAATDAEPLPASRSACSVLLAEDEDDLREVVADALERSGYQVTAVRSAGPAIVALREATFDIVVTDMLMPEGGGRAVLAELPTIDPRPPVLVITGRADDALLAELAAAPGTLCLSKPFGIAEVLRAVELLLAGAR